MTFTVGSLERRIEVAGEQLAIGCVLLRLISPSIVVDT